MTDIRNRPTKGMVSSEDSDAAWEALLHRISGESMSPKWKLWKEEKEACNMKQETKQMGKAKAGDTDGVEMAPYRNQAQDAGLSMGTDSRDEARLTENRKAMARPRRLWRWRKGLAGAAAVVLLAGVLGTSAGDSVWAAMLNTFRVEKLEGVGITMEELKSIEQSLQEGTSNEATFDLDRYGKVTQTGGGSIRTVSLADAEKELARSLARFPLRDGETVTSVLVEPSTTVTLNLNVKEVNELISQLGGETLLPEEADGKEITFSIPASVEQVAGKPADGLSEDDIGYKDARQTGRLQQMKAPELKLDESIDADQVRRAVLELPILPDTLRSRLAAIQDYRHTLPVPYVEGEMEQTKLLGRDVFVEYDNGYASAVWLDDGFLYQLSGEKERYPSKEALLKDVEEVIGR